MYGRAGKGSAYLEAEKVRDALEGGQPAVHVVAQEEELAWWWW